MQKTFYPKQEDITRSWYVVDAAGQNLGRLATRIAGVLMGKTKPEFTPGVDVGDFVIVVNVEKITVTGKRLDQKTYYRHSGYPGGDKLLNFKHLIIRQPQRIIRQAVWGMLPQNRLGRAMLKKLKIYANADHGHLSQKPEKLDI